MYIIPCSAANSEIEVIGLRKRAGEEVDMVVARAPVDLVGAWQARHVAQVCGIDDIVSIAGVYQVLREPARSAGTLLPGAPSVRKIVSEDTWCFTSLAVGSIASGAADISAGSGGSADDGVITAFRRE